jgi:peptide/nickel transport system ATP-binding protein
MASIPVPGRTPPGEHLGAIPGIVPALIGDIRGCAFRDRCAYAMPVCAQDVPALAADDHRWRCVHQQLPAAVAA